MTKELKEFIPRDNRYVVLISKHNDKKSKEIFYKYVWEKWERELLIRLFWKNLEINQSLEINRKTHLTVDFQTFPKTEGYKIDGYQHQRYKDR